MASTLFFDNGLGMAIDPNHFRLKSGFDFAENEISKEEGFNLIKLPENQLLQTEEPLEINQKVFISK